MTSIVLYISWGFLLLGSFLVLISSVGMLRFPDLFTRIHASSVATTLGAVCIIIGLILYNSIDAVLFKLTLILFFLLFTVPPSTHALARAAIEAGIKPKTNHQEKTTERNKNSQPSKNTSKKEGDASNS